MIVKVLSAHNLMSTRKWIFGSDKSEPRSKSTCKGQHGNLSVKQLQIGGEFVYEVSGFTTTEFRPDENSEWGDSLLVRYNGSNHYKLWSDRGSDRAMTRIKGRAYWFTFEVEWNENTRTYINVMPGDPQSNNNGYVINDESKAVREAIKCGFEAVHLFVSGRR
jgi:hypothetical protein